MDEEEKSSVQFTQLKKMALNDYAFDDSSSKDYSTRLTVLRRNINESRGTVTRANNSFISLVSCADSSTPNLQGSQFFYLTYKSRFMMCYTTKMFLN